MTGNKETVLIMAGGTGGHIFPALSIAEKLRERGVSVEWLGSDSGLEVQILSNTSYPLHLIKAHGLRGKGLLRLLLAPLMIIQATFQALVIIRQVKPSCVLGMGGFVTGPGGVAARLQRRKLLIHEQNAVPGITNRLLAPLAHLILEAFPGTFDRRRRVVTVGNPVRQAIVRSGRLRARDPHSPLRILVLGGSQGALAINQMVPAALALLPEEVSPELVHQAGRDKVNDTLAAYADAGIEVSASIQIQDFIDDMAASYAWADLVICRSGASTVAELAANGLPALLIPYPYHRDQQQLKNGRWLEKAGAAIVIQQQTLTAELLRDQLVALGNGEDRLMSMSKAALDIAITDADVRIADLCGDAANG